MMMTGIGKKSSPYQGEAGRGKNKATSLVEYLTLIGILVLAIVGTQVYLLRAIKGRLKVQTDGLGEQYSPGFSNYTSEQFFYSRQRQVSDVQGQSESKLLDHEVRATGPSVYDFDKPLVGRNAEKLLE